MRILLDTNILIRAFVMPEMISSPMRAKIEDRANAVLFSPVSIWEIGIKSALKKADFDVDPSIIWQMALDIDFEEMPITTSSAILASRLPLHHRDPFDRMLVAQAMNEPARLLTSDAKLARYCELVDVI